MSDVRGVLRTPPDDSWALHRFDPGPRLAPYAVWHWIVVWDLRDREPHHQTTLPHPSAPSGCGSSRAVCGRCCARRPPRSAARLQLPGLDADALTRAVEAAGDPEIELADRAVALLEEDRELNRVSDLAERLSLSVRTVQRLFADLVGLGPSWVIRRYRLHEAAAQATAGGDVDWARLAVTLGYYDQAHLVHDSTATVGTAPARYARDQ